MKCPMRAPAEKSTIPASRQTDRAILRPGSNKMRPATGPTTTKNGSRPRLNSRILSPFLAASIAVHASTANFANSDGWKETPPIPIHRRAPLISSTTAPANGSRRTNNSSDTTPRSCHAMRCHT